MLKLLKNFNDNYASAAQALTPIVIGIISWMYYKLYTESKMKEGDAASIVKPSYWSIGRKYKIMAVHKYKKSNDASGYDSVEQNSRPDQWKKLIKVKSSKLHLMHNVVPINTEDILEVIISRNGKEKWKIIKFNK